MLKSLLLSSSFIFLSCFVFAQNVGIGTSNPENTLHIKSDATNVEVKLESSDTTAMQIIPGMGKPYLQSIYRNGRFDQGFLFYANKAEVHT